MAVPSDRDSIKKAMEESVAHPNQLRWVKQIAISYSPSKDVWLATFDTDMTIIFNDVEYGNNTLYFKLCGVPIAYVTHKGLNEFARD